MNERNNYCYAWFQVHVINATLIHAFYPQTSQVKKNCTNIHVYPLYISSTPPNHKKCMYQAIYNNPFTEEE